MSLFTLLECWSFRSSKYGVMNPFFLLVANLLDEEIKENQVILANESGLILIIRPKKNDLDFIHKGALDEHEELLLTFDTHLAICDIQVGRFHQNNSKGNTIAVIHKNQLSVYSLRRTKIQSENGSNLDDDSRINAMEWSYELVLCYELKFEKNLFCGYVSHAKVESRKLDVLLVQTLDCRVIVCRGSKVLGFKDLYECIFPGPSAVSRDEGTFVTFNTTMQLQGYKVDNIVYSAPFIDSEREIISPSWMVSLYEPIFQLEAVNVVRSHNEDSFFIATGRHIMLIISQAGQVLFSHQLDFSPNLLYVYDVYTAVDETSQENANDGSPLISDLRYLMTTTEGYLLIYQGTQIVWSAKLLESITKIALPKMRQDSSVNLPTIGQNFPPGVMAILTSDGLLRMTYLGTNPARISTFKPTKTDMSDKETESSTKPTKLLQTETELEELNKKIAAMTLNRPVPKLLPSGDNRQEIKVVMQVKLREDTEKNDVSNFIDVLMLFHGHSNPSEFDPVSLSVNSCFPIEVIPSYINFPLTDIHSPGSSNFVFKRFCSLSVGLKNSNAPRCIFPLDLTVRLSLAYTERNTLVSTTERSCFVEESVDLPLHWFCVGQASKKTHVTGSYRLTLDLNSELVAHNPRLHKLLPNLWPSANTGSVLYIQMKQKPNHDCDNNEDDKPDGVYLLENVKKAQIRLQGNYPELFVPILKQLLQEMRAFCKQVGLLTPANCLFRLPTSNSPEASSTTDALMTELFVSSPAIHSFSDYLFQCLCEHLEARLTLATQVAANVIQARHFRAVQSQILNRIQDQIPVSLNGFDTLLEASLHQLIEGCQSVIENAQKQQNLGTSVVAMITLLILLYQECVPHEKADSDYSAAFQSLNPSQLLAIVEANESIEVSRGQDSLPECEETERPDCTSYVGLEEYLEISVSSLLSQVTECEAVKSGTLSTGVIPDINRLMQQFMFLLKKY